MNLASSWFGPTRAQSQFHTGSVARRLYEHPVMLFKWICACLLILVVRDVVTDTNYICEKDMNQYSTVYYNLTTRLGLKSELEDATRLPPSQTRISFRGMACNCENLTCGCCAGVNLTAFNFDRHACTNFTYDPDEFSIKLAVVMNENVIYTNIFSAKNPPPLCMPLPYLPFVSFCVRFFDIYTPGKNLHACVDFETHVANWPILILHFNCLKIGVDGISWTRPEDGSNVLQTKPQTSDPEIYDEVNFEHDPAVLTSYNLNMTSEQENNIGQLKL